MAKFLIGLFLFCATICLAVAKHEVYEGHSLYEVSVRTADQARLVNALENQIPIDVFVYSHPDRAGQMLVPGDVKAEFEALLTAADVDYRIQVANVKEQLEMEDQLLAAASARVQNRSSRAIPGLNFEEIHRYEVVDEYLVNLAAAYPDLVTVASAGSSVEGRDVKYVKISTTNFEDTSKPVVFLMSLLHAREWATLPATLYAIEKLVIDVQERDLLETIDWIILPIANPDGYEFSHTTTRFWRKNRARGFFIGDFCMGVDLNRNFDSFWATASSGSVCMETFHGPNAFSEPETQNVQRLLAEHGDRIQLFVDVHSFGSLILYAYGNGEFPPNALTVNVNAVNQAQAIDRVKWDSKPNYVVGNIYLLLYAASGGSSDYAQGIGIPFSYCYELPAWRGVQGVLNGFLVEPEFIEQVGMETWEGIKTGARFSRDLYRSRADLK